MHIITFPNRTSSMMSDVTARNELMAHTIVADSQEAMHSTVPTFNSVDPSNDDDDAPGPVSVGATVGAGAPPQGMFHQYYNDQTLIKPVKKMSVIILLMTDLENLMYTGLDGSPAIKVPEEFVLATSPFYD